MSKAKCCLVEQLGLLQKLLQPLSHFRMDPARQPHSRVLPLSSVRADTRRCKGEEGATPTAYVALARRGKGSPPRRAVDAAPPDASRAAGDGDRATLRLPDLGTDRTRQRWLGMGPRRRWLGIGQRLPELELGTSMVLRAARDGDVAAPRSADAMDGVALPPAGVRDEHGEGARWHRAWGRRSSRTAEHGEGARTGMGKELAPTIGRSSRLLLSSRTENRRKEKKRQARNQ